MISNLNIEEREKLADLYEKLKEVKKSQSELNALTEPLNAELDNLEKQEKDYDLEYSELFESQNEEDVERLANITAEMVEISKRKLEIKKKLDEYEPEFEKNNLMAKEYSEEIDHITNVGVFGEGVIHLDKKGNVIKPSEIRVEIQEFKRPEKEPVVSVGKNQIIETKKNVANFIKEKFSITKAELVELKDNIKMTIHYIGNIKENYKEKYNKYYEEKTNKINQIIKNYKNKKAENAKTEEEAENIEFYEGDKKENIEDAMYIEKGKSEIADNLNADLEEKIKNEQKSEIENPDLETIESEKEKSNQLFKNIDKNDIELHNMQRGNNDSESFKTVMPEKKATVSNEKMSLDNAYVESDKLFKNMDKNDIELHNIQRGNNDSESFKTVMPEKKATVSNEKMSLDNAYAESDKLFKNMDKNGEELKQMSQNNYNNIIQVVSEKKNRVATAKPSKISSMIEIFNKIIEKTDAMIDRKAQKKAAKEASNIILNMKKEELEKAKERLKEQEKLNYENYQNSVNEINNMGMAM